ncbi:peroxin-19 [Pelomyxa schiedti]|nr:peroxin-19 [Pelomyxa schiedti]
MSGEPEDLDGFLESALREYESNTSSTTPTTQAQPPPPTDPNPPQQPPQTNVPATTTASVGSTTTVVTVTGGGVAEPQPTAGGGDTTPTSTGTAATSDLLTSLQSLSEEIKRMDTNIPVLSEDDGSIDEFFNQEFGSVEDPEVQAALVELFKPFVSKQLLYPPMLQLKEKMPSWIEKNASKLSPENLQKYRRQQQCINEICTIFESKENPDGDEDLLSIVQLLQEMGQPPAELAASISDTTPLPQLPSTKSSDPCAMM